MLRSTAYCKFMFKTNYLHYRKISNVSYGRGRGRETEGGRLRGGGR